MHTQAEVPRPSVTQTKAKPVTRMVVPKACIFTRGVAGATWCPINGRLCRGCEAVGFPRSPSGCFGLVSSQSAS